MLVQMLSVPADAVNDLADEINLEIDVEVAREIMYRFGFRCGRCIVEDFVTAYEEIPRAVSEIMEEMGLCKVHLKKISGDLIELEFEQITTEKNFVMGAIAGLITQMMHIPFECIEENGRYYVREVKGGHRRTESALPELTPEKEKIALTEKGIFYMYEGNDLSKLYRGLKKFISAGYPTLCVTREFPEHIMKNFGIQTKYIWLTGADKKEYDYAIQPTNLAGLYSDIKDFIISNKNAVVFISGIEYIISNTSYSQALRFLQSLRDRIALSQAIGVLYIDPGTLDPKEVKTFERELVLTKWFDLL
ncbi:MAG: DUF835 domain-containing protein [Thermoplasmata archaeon]